MAWSCHHQLREADPTDAALQSGWERFRGSCGQATTRYDAQLCMRPSTAAFIYPVLVVRAWHRMFLVDHKQ